MGVRKIVMFLQPWEIGSQLVDDEEDWLGSQLDQESFNDQTLTYCILKDLEDMQRLVTSPRVEMIRQEEKTTFLVRKTT